MAILNIPYSFSAGAVIIAAQHNANFSIIYSDYNGNIQNANISPSAAIDYSKLNLTGHIVDADINSAAAIANSKLNLATIAQNITMNGQVLIGAANQGDIFYDNGTQIVRLTYGVNGQYLQTQGASANPQWATVVIPPTYNADASATIASALTQESTTSASYVKKKEIALFGSGALGFSFQLKSLGGQTVYAKIYKNGVAVGTEKSTGSTTYTTLTDSVSGWANIDLIQLYIHADGAETCYVNNFYVYGTQCTININ